MISHFDDLLQAAKSQAQPQRLLLIFCGAELPDDANAEQRAGFESGVGGALVPLMCVDKDPASIDSFIQLSQEASSMHQGWRVLLAGALSGATGAAPSEQAASQALDRLLGQIHTGRMDQVLAQTIAFTTTGQAVALEN